MKTENLETLLIDRAVGELSPAAVELLDEYLAQNPEIATKAESLVDTLQLARKTLVAPKMTPRRAFPRERLQSAQRAWRWRTVSFQTMKLAACLVLGLAAGWFGKTQTNHKIEVTVRAPAPFAQPAKPAAKTATEGGFWSLARLEAEARKRAEKKADESNRLQLRWESPLKMPEVEKKS